MTIRPLTLLYGILMIVSASQANDPIKDGLAYAMEQDGCGLDHGYICLNQPEDDFLSLDSHNRMVPGNFIKAWKIAAGDFDSIDDLDPEQRNYRHYKFGFTENDHQYIVLFQALLLPAVEEGKVTGTTHGTFGRTTRYWINKQTMTIDKRLFYKS